MSKVLLETDASNNAQNYYVYGLDLIARIDNSNNTHYYHDDFRGSIIALTDINETITHKYQYADFGAITQIEEANLNPYRYVGKHGIQFEANGLYFMRARYYDAHTGRFLTEDPIWATNLYPYAGNNPVINIDPTGEVIFTATFLIGAAVVGGGLWGLNDMVGSLLNSDLADKYESIDLEESDRLRAKSNSQFYNGISKATAATSLLGLNGSVFKNGLKSGLPQKIFSRKAAQQVTPGIRRASGQYIDDVGRVQPWKASYDKFGRLIERTDWNAANKVEGIQKIHHHLYKYLPKGQLKSIDHIPGIGPTSF